MDGRTDGQMDGRMDGKMDKSLQLDLRGADTKSTKWRHKET